MSPNSAAAHQWAVVAPTLPAPMIVTFARRIGHPPFIACGVPVDIAIRVESLAAGFKRRDRTLGAAGRKPLRELDTSEHSPPLTLDFPKLIH